MEKKNIQTNIILPEDLLCKGFIQGSSDNLSEGYPFQGGPDFRPFPEIQAGQGFIWGLLPCKQGKPSKHFEHRLRKRWQV